ncbi:MAG: hypothetical protein ABIP61_10360 [Burkholderiaceae bacterium]
MTTIVVDTMRLAAIRLISLGVVGECFGRTFEEAKARPLLIPCRDLAQGLTASRA